MVDEQGVKKLYTLNSDIVFDDVSDCFDCLEESKYYGFLWNKCFKRELTTGVRFDERLNFLEDHLWTYEVLHKARRIQLLATSVYNHFVRNNGSLSCIQNPKVVAIAMNLEYDWKHMLNAGKHLRQTTNLIKNYRRNIHRIVCNTYYGRYTYVQRKEYSCVDLRISEGLFREDNLFLNSRLPFFLRDLIIRLLLRVKGRFAPYE